MAKVLTCRDVGVDCDFVARGATVDEVLQQAREHATKDHGFADIPPELVEQVKAAIKDEEAASA
jgi:predicted small metal-binding protein